MMTLQTAPKITSFLLASIYLLGLTSLHKLDFYLITGPRVLCTHCNASEIQSCGNMRAGNALNI